MSDLMGKLRNIQRLIDEQPQSDVDEMVIHIHPDDMTEAATYDWFAGHVKAFDKSLFGVQYTESRHAVRGSPRLAVKLHEIKK